MNKASGVTSVEKFFINQKWISNKLQTWIEDVNSMNLVNFIIFILIPRKTVS
jgi:hypothetical protein